MVPDAIYERCLPILTDAAVEEEDKTDRLEALLKRETTLTGSSLEKAVLDVLWRHRESTASSSPSPSPSLHAARHIIIRRPSPAPWQLPRTATPLASSPMSAITAAAPPAFAGRANKPALASPFGSPRPSPRLPFASPRIPHSPDLNAYEFPRRSTPPVEVSGDIAHGAVDWLVNDDDDGTASLASSTGAALAHEDGSHGTAAFAIPQQINMSPYDILRSVVGEARSDDDIERALDANGYDVTAAIMELIGDPSATIPAQADMLAGGPGSVLVGKSLALDPPTQIMSSAATTPRTGIVCKYFLSSGSCLRADCRFSHDLSRQICRLVLPIHLLSTSENIYIYIYVCV